MNVRIGVTDYNISMLSNAEMNAGYEEIGETEESSIVGGLMHPMLCEIEINKELSAQTRIQSFFHECTHAMLDQIGEGELYADEDFVDAFSKQIYGFCKFNNLDKIYTLLEDKKVGKNK